MVTDASCWRVSVLLDQAAFRPFVPGGTLSYDNILGFLMCPSYFVVAAACNKIKAITNLDWTARAAGVWGGNRLQAEG